MNTCPSYEMLSNWLANDVVEVERDALEYHVDECSACQAFVESLLDTAMLQLPAARTDFTFP